MANPYSPSFRPILSNPLASALQGLATGGMQGYQMVEQSRQRQADNAFRAKQLQNQQDELQLRQMQAGYTPAGLSPLRGSGSLLGMANQGLGAATGTLGLAGVLPQTDVVANQPAHLDFQNSTEGHRLAAELLNQRQMQGIKNADAVRNLLLQYGTAPGTPGIRNAPQYQSNADTALYRSGQQAFQNARLGEDIRHNQETERTGRRNAATAEGRLGFEKRMGVTLAAERVQKLKDQLSGSGLSAKGKAFVIEGFLNDQRNAPVGQPFNADESMQRNLSTWNNVLKPIIEPGSGSGGTDSTDDSDNPEEP